MEILLGFQPVSALQKYRKKTMKFLEAAAARRLKANGESVVFQCFRKILAFGSARMQKL